MKPRHLGAALALAAAAFTAAAADPDPAEAQKLRALFDRQFQAVMERIPEIATYRGDHRWGDRLADVSPQAIAEFDALSQRWLAEAQAIRRDRLDATDRTSLDLFIGARQREIDFQAFDAFRGMRLGSLGGPHSDFANLLSVVPTGRREQVDQLLARMAAVPRRMAQELAQLRKSQAAGWVPSRDVLERVLQQIDGQLGAEMEASPFYAPFKRLGSGIPAAEQAELRAAGRAAIERHVLPALRSLRAYVADEALPKAPANGALANYPGGTAVYEALVRQQTTTTLPAREIHAIGLRELARINAEMEAVMKAVKFEGDFPAFVKYLNTDPKFFHASPEALLAGYRDIAKRIDAELPRLFAELPRVPYGVRAMPAFRGPDAAEYYTGPPIDGSRPGWFNAAATGYLKKPTWSMATLTAHEAMPGHHLQNARSLELKNLPDFRRSGFGYTAYSEGWALYAETLGHEMGLYDDPYARFGHLQAQAFRAARLVVDTGIHALGWTRQQSIDFMTERTTLHRDFVTSEIDRYTSTPGQALAYMIGQLKIIELRDRAKAKLGPKFDIRRFHNAVIDQGALPLDVLDRLIDEWITAGG